MRSHRVQACSYGRRCSLVRVVRVVLVIAAVALAPLVFASPAVASFAPTEIVYSLRTEPESGSLGLTFRHWLYVADYPSGENRRLLFGGARAGGYSSLDFNPERTKLAIGHGGVSRIYAENEGMVLIPAPGNCVRPKFRPTDGAVVACSAGANGIRVFDTATLTQIGMPILLPSPYASGGNEYDWLQDGSGLLIPGTSTTLCTPPDTYFYAGGLWRYDFASQSFTTVLPPDCSAPWGSGVRVPETSPDGTRFAYLTGRQDEIREAQLDGSGDRALPIDLAADEDLGQFQWEQGGDGLILMIHRPVEGWFFPVLGRIERVDLIRGTRQVVIEHAPGEPYAFSDALYVPPNSPPTVSLVADTTAALEGSSLALTATANDPDGDSVSLSWSYAATSTLDPGTSCVLDAVSGSATFGCNDDGTFEITVSVSDGVNPVVTASVTVEVMNAAPTATLTAPVPGALYRVGDSVAASFAVTDAGANDTLDCVIDWGDGAVTTAALDAGVCGGGHAYTSAGIYLLQGVVTDDDGASATVSVDVVVYDPTGGFASGNGWVTPGGSTSDAGDVLPGLDGTSSARFAFVIRYRPGADTVPGGEFRFSARQFSLSSEEFEWLVLTDSNWARFQGLAEIDGLDGLYPFRVEARDGDPSGATDRFVLKIYPAGSDPAVTEPLYKVSGEVERGQIKIHTG